MSDKEFARWIIAIIIVIQILVLVFFGPGTDDMFLRR